MVRTFILAAALAAPGPPGHSTLDQPVGRVLPWRADSGPRDNAGAAPALVWAALVTVENAGWLRVYFADARLGRGSAVRMTSLLDGETQVLDAAGLAMWGNASAYFNGDAVLVELVAGPGAKADRVIIAQVAARREPARPAGDSGTCGICGVSDDRQPTAGQWTARVLPAGCTAVVYNEESCMVSAGHCVDAEMVVQFNVPGSDPDCTINNPPVADQYPIVGFDLSNGGVGNDWSVLVPGANNLGEKPYDRYGELRPIAVAPVSAGQTVEVAGYGIDDTCTLSQTLQADGGLLSGVLTGHYLFNVDIAPGNSGSALLRLGEIAGVVTHCPCPNVATRVDLPAFAAALTDACADGQGGFCPGAGDCCSANGSPGCSDAECCETVCACDPFCCTAEWDAYCAGEGFEGSGCGAALLCRQCDAAGPVNDDCAEASPIGDGATSFATTGATTDGPALPAGCDEGFGLSLVRDVWFRYTASCTGAVTVSTCGTANYDTRLAAYRDGDCPGPLAGCNDDGPDCPLFTSVMTFNALGGQAYLLRVGGFDGSGAGTLTIACEAGCPWDCADDDGTVGIVDFLELLLQWETAGSCDADGDGTVGIVDLLEMLMAWGRCDS